MLDAVTISEARPAGGTGHPWDSATAPLGLRKGGTTLIAVPAGTAVTLDVAAYTLDPSKGQLIAFDINTPDGAVRSGSRNGATAHIRNNAHEAAAQDRFPGY